MNNETEKPQMTQAVSRPAPLTKFQSAIRDAAAIVGFAMLGTGLWWFRPWVSLSVMGSLLLTAVAWSLWGPAR